MMSKKNPCTFVTVTVTIEHLQELERSGLGWQSAFGSHTEINFFWDSRLNLLMALHEFVSLLRLECVSTCRVLITGSHWGTFVPISFKSSEE